MEDEIEDIDLSGTNIHNFLYNQGMRASRVREIYQLCVNNINPQPTPFIFGDEVDRDKHALRRFRNALMMDLVANVQYAYQQCGLRDDGQGMTPEELLDEVAEFRVDDSDAPSQGDKDVHNEPGGERCERAEIGGAGIVGFYRDGEPAATGDPSHQSDTRRVLEPHTKPTMRKKPTPPAEKFTRQSRTPESSATDARGVPRECRTVQTRRPVTRMKPTTNPQATSSVPKPSNPQSAFTHRGVRKAVSAQLTLSLRPTVKDEAEKRKSPSTAPTSRPSRPIPGRSQRPLSVPIGGTRVLPAVAADVPVRRWR